MKIKAAVVQQEGQPFVIDEIDLDEHSPNHHVSHRQLATLQLSPGR